jgi:transcriptional regulator with XRE-family HTH domain
MVTPLHTLRKSKNIPGRRVAIAVGLEPSHYRRIEIGEANASPDAANRIAQYFKNAVTRDQILFPEDYIQAGGRKSTATRQLQKAS